MKISTTNPRNKRIKPTFFKECKANLAISDPDKAAEDLNAALEDGDKEVFRLALKNVIEAQGGYPNWLKNQRSTKKASISSCQERLTLNYTALMRCYRHLVFI
ncbi:MAG TPA: hypothetical protein ENG03_06035 [Thioploca sp.]|nr:MAG: hypothetical protein DRR19_18705 [Gammaproteobacteria bacterium]HDN26645.1 hypothetical protein [Thioploca sp.]